MLKKFFSYYRPYKGLFILDFSCAVLVALLELAFPLAVNRVVDDLLPTEQWDIILWACVGLLLIYVVSGGLHFIVTYWGHMLGVNIETDMRRELFVHAQSQSFRFFDNTKTGHLVSRMTTDLFDIGEMAHHGPEDVFIAIMTLVGSFGLMFWINPQLALLTFAVIPIIIFLALFFSRKMTRAFRVMFEDVADYNARVENNISGVRVVQAFANEHHEIAQFKVNNERFRKTKLIAYWIMGWNSGMSNVLMKVVSIFVLLCGAWFVLQGELTNGQFVACILLVTVLLGPIKKIESVIEMYPKGFAGFRRYLDLLESEPDIQDAPDAVEAPQFQGNIEFENVSFGYEEDDYILDQFNLSIQAGETVALVGPSGAGKTTICSLLPRFYDVEKGKITIDGMDTKKLTLESLRSQVGIVQQDVFLFDATIRENIAYGKLDATEEEIWEAARRAQLEEVILAQDQQLNTMIGERGVKLSGGQKQRLSIARLFLKNPSILILDEATSALDTETEAAIQQALSELTVGRTTLVIAHRLATIKDADRIVVITKDGVEEQGSHEQLLASDGAYSRLHKAQFTSEST